MSKHFFPVCTAALLFLMACNNTRILSSWQAEDVDPQKYNKLLVIGMMGARDQALRQNVENSMVQQLQASGINAVAATKQYGPRTFRDMKEEDAVKMVSNDAFDGVLVVELIDRNKERNYTPGYVSYTPYGVIRGRWWPHYSVVYDRIYSPGYYTVSTSYSLEINLYDPKKEKLEYSAQVRTFDPESSMALGNDVSKTVVADMLKKGVIVK
jgi:hypothetical protein